MKEVKIVCGEFCCGKGYIINNLFPQHKVIEVSSIVKEIIKNNKRSNLQKTFHLAEQISKRLIDIIMKNDYIVIDGIRQLDILIDIKINVEYTHDIELLWIESFKEDRKKRFLQRKSDKDDLSFNEIESNDIILGIKEVENYCKQRGCTIINN